MTDARQPVKTTCKCGAVEVIVMSGTAVTGLRCWQCPPEKTPRPKLVLLRGDPS